MASVYFSRVGIRTIWFPRTFLPVGFSRVGASPRIRCRAAALLASTGILGCGCTTLAACCCSHCSMDRRCSRRFVARAVTHLSVDLSPGIGASAGLDSVLVCASACVRHGECRPRGGPLGSSWPLLSSARVARGTVTILAGIHGRRDRGGATPSARRGAQLQNDPPRSRRVPVVTRWPDTLDRVQSIAMLGRHRRSGIRACGSRRPRLGLFALWRRPAEHTPLVSRGAS